MLFSHAYAGRWGPIWDSSCAAGFYDESTRADAPNRGTSENMASRRAKKLSGVKPVQRSAKHFRGISRNLGLILDEVVPSFRAEDVSTGRAQGGCPGLWEKSQPLDTVRQCRCKLLGVSRWSPGDETPAILFGPGTKIAI